MHDLLLIFIFIIVVIILIFAWSYATSAAAAIGLNPGDDDLSTAHSYLAWTVSILAIIIVGMFIGIICLIIFGPEFLPTFGKSIVYFALFIMIIALIAVGIMAAIASSYINSSPNASSYSDAYSDAVTAAVIALLPIGLVFICYIVTWYHSKHANPDDEQYNHFNNEYNGGNY